MGRAGGGGKKERKTSEDELARATFRDLSPQFWRSGNYERAFINISRGTACSCMLAWTVTLFFAVENQHPRDTIVLSGYTGDSASLSTPPIGQIFANRDEPSDS